MVLGLGLGLGLALGLAEDRVSSISAEIWSKQSFVPAGYSKTRPDTRQDSRGRLGRSSERKPPRIKECDGCLLYTSPSPRDGLLSRMPSSA